jgi:hypothetical protein
LIRAVPRPADPNETNDRSPGGCSNGIDDDADGRVDFPRDPGCIFAADSDEADPGFAPQCANMRDDDRNGRIDFPDDPGCRFAADNLEENQGEIPPRCADGVDNDDDGLHRPGRRGLRRARRDNDEADPMPATPLCANGQCDDDGDDAASTGPTAAVAWCVRRGSSAWKASAAAPASGIPGELDRDWAIGGAGGCNIPVAYNVICEP